jgi:hypothetical protein
MRQDITVDAMNRAAKLAERAQQILEERFGLGSQVKQLTPSEARKRKMAPEEIQEMIELVGVDRVMDDAEELFGG